MSIAPGASVAENRGCLYEPEHLPFEAGARQALRGSTQPILSINPIVAAAAFPTLYRLCLPKYRNSHLAIFAACESVAVWIHSLIEINPKNSGK